jgi:hypothetical protein
MSLITELIERLRKEADGYMGYRSKRAIRVKHLLREAADTIETLSAKVHAANMERSTAYYNGGWIPVSEKYEHHIDHTDCIWYGNDSGCPVTCSQYRDGWNDAMDYIFKNGDGYRPYRRNENG